MTKRSIDLILVDWEDAWGVSGWRSSGVAGEEHKPLKVTTIGFVVKADKLGVSVSSGFDENGMALGQTFIPKKMIKTIKKVKW